MEVDVILFDLDGTLLDSKEGITKSVQYALGKMGISIEDRDDLVKFIGPPLKESFEKYYGVDGVEAIRLYREHFVGEMKMLENEMYPGIEKLLQDLVAKGKTLIVATAKPTVYSKTILEHFDLAKYFLEIQGSELDLTLTQKEEVIAAILARHPKFSKESMVMIGDREHDMYGAKVNGLSSIGVLYGYGDEAELKEAGATWIVKDAKEIEELLLGTK